MITLKGMLKPLGKFSTLVLATLFSLSVIADTSVWEVSSGEKKVYLGGTVHLLRPGDYPLPQPYEDAYQQADELYFETDISGMNDMSVQVQMLQQLTYPDSRTLQTVLDEEAYTALSEYLKEIGMPIMMMEKFRPGLVVSTLQVFEFQRMGFTPQGVDAFFNTRAMGDAKPIGELESIQSQLQFIADMGAGNESEFILLSLRDMDLIETSMEEMISAWRQGDNERLAALFIDDMKEQTPALYQSLLVERNNNWMPIIETMFSDEDTEFVLVGAAHLVGEDGLLNLLLAKGYDIKQL